MSCLSEILGIHYAWLRFTLLLFRIGDEVRTTHVHVALATDSTLAVFVLLFWGKFHKVF